MFIRDKKGCDVYDSRPSCSDPLFISRKELMDSLNETERTRNLARMKECKSAYNNEDVNKLTIERGGAEISRSSKPAGFEKILILVAFALCAVLFVSTEYDSVPAFPVDNVRNLKNPNERPVMHTFFMRKESLRAGNRKTTNLVRAWIRAWSAAGWEPKVLTIEDAEKHPDFEHFRKVVTQIQNPPAEEGSDQYYFFMRWLAMAAQENGGWMSSYDTIPLDITVGEGYNLPNYGTFTSYEQNSHALLSGDASEWERVAQKMMQIASARSEIDSFNDGQALGQLRDSGLFSMVQELSVVSYPYKSNGIVNCEVVAANRAAHLSQFETKKAVDSGLVPSGIGRTNLIFDLWKKIDRQCRMHIVDEQQEDTPLDEQPPPTIV